MGSFRYLDFILTKYKKEISLLFSEKRSGIIRVLVLITRSLPDGQAEERSHPVLDPFE